MGVYDLFKDRPHITTEQLRTLRNAVEEHGWHGTHLEIYYESYRSYDSRIKSRIGYLETFLTGDESWEDIHPHNTEILSITPVKSGRSYWVRDDGAFMNRGPYPYMGPVVGIRIHNKINTGADGKVIGPYFETLEAY